MGKCTPPKSAGVSLQSVCISYLMHLVELVGLPIQSIENFTDG